MSATDALLAPPPGLDHRPHRHAGSGVVEVVLMSPLVGFIALVIFGAGQIVFDRIATDGAAHAAARAASLELTMGEAQSAAAAAVEASLGDRCTAYSVHLSGDLAPGGTVTATLTCTVDVESPVWPAQELTSTALSPVDAWRGVP
ncbi:TadE/TadG family type IV pilus assembly protein [Glycomyces sp. NPDC047369]